MEDDNNIDSDHCDSLFHGSPEKKDLLFVDTYELSHGPIPMTYAGGLEERWEAALASRDNQVGAVILRLHCIEPQTGLDVPLTFLLPPATAQRLGLNLGAASFQIAAGLEDIWELIKSEPDEQGLKVAASWEYLAEELDEDDDDEDE
jgi:hypothetical protein